MRISINQGIAGHVATTGGYTVYVLKKAFIIYSDKQILINFLPKRFIIIFCFLQVFRGGNDD